MSMKTIVVSAIALSAAAFASTSIAAEATASGTGTVIKPIAIVKAVDLVFGEFAPGAGGSVTVSTSGARTATGAILSTVGSSPTAAKFDVTGEADATYSIAIAPSANLADTATTPNTMALETFSDLTAGNAVTGNVATGTLTAGAQSIYVGGKLTVGATQAAGTYSGNVKVTVEYN
ncbi:DUF4402 domain-containing protein [Lysobacter sp. D1-1-M9]|uniref:DUF4402 domain-containing protein n=1 Tax=Novilysobacter longmucuonensis TaxID=3098603 RepID=UPI002FC58D15